jgi:hypothetical protein
MSDFSDEPGLIINTTITTENAEFISTSACCTPTHILLEQLRGRWTEENLHVRQMHNRDIELLDIEQQKEIENIRQRFQKQRKEILRKCSEELRRLNECRLLMLDGVHVPASHTFHQWLKHIWSFFTRS